MVYPPQRVGTSEGRLFFAVSERFKESLMELGIAAERIQTIYNGIDFDDAPVRTCCSALISGFGKTIW